jgi:diguanylate cyclase (GGDEF)-like protein/PAS domain S-box-containing protein
MSAPTIAYDPVLERPSSMMAASLQRSLREQQALLDNAGVGIVFIRQRVIVRCNQCYADIFGYPGEHALVGINSEHLHPSRDELRSLGREAYRTLSAGLSFRTQRRLRRKDGSLFWGELTGRLINPGDAREGSIWIVSDIDDRLRAQQALSQAHELLEQQVRDRTRELSATVENLHREIADRKLLAERSARAIELAKANDTPLAVMFLDLDHFKHVNDSLGHRVGDALLVEIARRLRAVVRDRDTVARIGGDEFVLLLPGANAQGAARVAGKLQEASRQAYQIDRHELTIAPSMGIALYPRDGHDIDSLTQAADAAMYHAKQAGRNTYRFFTPQMQAQSLRALQLENALRRALERNQLYLHYQPQITLSTGRVRSVEALLRWEHPELGSVSPAEFIPVAEDSGQILQIGEWVLRSAMQQLQAWRSAGLQDLKVAVNLSAIQFHQQQLPEIINRILLDSDLPPDSLELELTEGVAIHDPRQATATMDRLREHGVRLAMDDFGTGYSSLSQLKRFQIYKLKIDQSFIQDLDPDSNDRAIVSAIIRMAQALGMQTTAEGVETEAQLEFLREQGCDEAQGYHFSRPLAPDALETFLRSQD